MNHNLKEINNNLSNTDNLNYLNKFIKSENISYDFYLNSNLKVSELNQKKKNKILF